MGETPRRRWRRAATTTAVLASSMLLAMPAQAAPTFGADSARSIEDIARDVRLENLNKHLQALQSIADANGGNRYQGTAGYTASRDYVVDQLRGVGYQVSFTNVPYRKSWTEVAPPVLERTAPDAKTYTPTTDFVTIVGSGSADVTAEVQAVDLVLPQPATVNGSTSGCEESDFATFVPGRIALLQRGTCPHTTKAVNAKAAGAAGVIYFNDGFAGRTDPFPFDILEWRWGFPILYTSYAAGLELAAANTTVRIKVDAAVEAGTDHNIIAETPGGLPDSVVMVGAHLDSVHVGPGLNDNGSGVAAVLETALRIRRYPLHNTVRFAFWAAEESGNVGSKQYIADLPQAEQDKIKLYLNFDMIASPNYAFKVYDGDNSDGVGGPAGPPGSAQIEEAFQQFYDTRSIPHNGRDLNGGSDYAPFSAVGIPIGGVHTGTGDLKTAQEAVLFGGQAGVAYDPCYHLACDTISNVSQHALDVNADAVAVTTLRFAVDTSSIPPRSAGQSVELPLDEDHAPEEHAH